LSREFLRAIVEIAQDGDRRFWWDGFYHEETVKDKSRADYEALKQITQLFADAAQQIDSQNRDLNARAKVLEDGAWVGQAAQAFQAEMNGIVMPSMRRLANALGDAQRTTAQISAAFKEAEDAASAVLKHDGLMPGGQGDAQAAANSEGDGGWVPGWLKDIAAGVFQGDFSDNESGLKLLAQIVTGFIPIVGQIADVRDIIANIKNVVDGKEGAWLGLGIAVIAIIPGLDALKGAKALKPVLKALGDSGTRELIEFVVKNPQDLARIGKTLAAVVENPKLIEALTRTPEALLPIVRNASPELIAAMAKNPEAAEVILKGGPELIEQAAKNPDAIGDIAANAAKSTSPMLAGKFDSVFDATDASKTLRNMPGVSLNKLADSELAELEAKRAAHGINPRQNISDAKVDVQGTPKPVKTDYEAHAGPTNPSKIPGGAPKIDPGKEIFESSTAATASGSRVPRANDSEVKLFTQLARDMGAKPGDLAAGKSFPDVTGTIRLRSELVPCESCSGVIEQFKRLYPNVNIDIYATPRISFPN
jgi:WXG100 family type VII secretion target